jgi:hypothetical protein
MKILRRLVTVLTFATALLPSNLRADVDIELQSCIAIIFGEITAADAEELASSDCPRPQIVLRNSPGGHATAGMKIGRWARENQASTTVGKDQYCYSTCALVFIAGVRRINFGVIGLHRPYLTGAPQAAERIPALVSAMRDNVRAYVSEMGVSPEFASVMLETPPEQMRLYRQDEIHNLVAETDAVHDEVRASLEAQRYGISTDEARRRRQDADEECNLLGEDVQSVQSFLECRDAVMRGQSLE